ncbi:MAG: tetratricopeptide repeat protein [Ferruginibacter sp.]
MFKRLFLSIFIVSIGCAFLNSAMAQAPTWTIDLLGKEKKPEKFENRKLGSEKMADKKFTVIRHFFQNNYTHYNYYYNAHNKINSVLERAKAAQKDDYTTLLSYYPYTLENTATQKSELDSVIFKATAGILLHDLRNDWVDNMYMLMGKAFYFRKDFDSAAATFQFINYNLFPRKKHEEDNRIVGTSDASSDSRLSIANKEKRNILQKVTAEPPSRNDALIWMARTLIEQNEMGESAGLINTLQYDPNLPARLRNDLDDINAYWFYKQNIYDSAASYLEKALSNADNKQDFSRSEFLLAQLYEMTNQFDQATHFYQKASLHTVDPLLDIHARLNNAKMLKNSNPEELTNSINNLIRMAKKDKFESYRDIIYYSAGELAMQKPDSNAAVEYFTKSLQYNELNLSYKNKTFLQLADIAFDRKQYRAAFAWYDSLQSGDTTLNDRLAVIQARRNALSKIVEKIIIIEREDSLQSLAAMAPAARELFVKKIVKRLRKEKGLKESENNPQSGGTMIGFDTPFGNKKDEPVDLFASANKGEWYFYNASTKSKGFNDFKRKWGAVKNTDNWRRKNAMEATANNIVDPGQGLANTPEDIDKAPTAMDAAKNPGNNNLSTSPVGSNPNEIVQPDDISYEGLMSNIPLSPEKMNISHSLLSVNLFELARLFQIELEDYQQAIVTYEQSLSRYPDSLYNGELYFGLYYCYNKLGYKDKAAYYKNLLNKNFAASHSALLLNDPAAANPFEKNAEGTNRYQAIYNLLIEGSFDRAFAEKKKADSVYGKNYWSPQLLYIEAVYHIKQHNDSSAINVLNNIISLYPNAKLAPKAATMIDVLKRRSEIENYLTKLEITRAKDDEIVTIDDRSPLVRNDLNLIKSPVNVTDTSKTIIKPSTMQVKDTIAVPEVILTRIKDSSKLIAQEIIKKDPAKKITAPDLPKVKDVLATPPNVYNNGPFTLNTTLPHNVVMVMDKVDITYVNESKNAFTRYLNESFKGELITLARDAIDKDKAVLIFGPFANATVAYQFLEKVKKAAPTEISWLPANKYNFYPISDENLQLLKINKDIPGYISLLNKVYPGKF